MGELDSFHDEARAWIRENAPKSLWGTSGSGPFEGYWGGRKCEEADLDILRWRDLGIEKRWTAPSWPTAYGGDGLSREKEEIIHAEMKAIEALRQVWGESDARRFTIFVFVSMLAYSAQDLILEPFAGLAFGNGLND